MGLSGRMIMVFRDIKGSWIIEPGLFAVTCKRTNLLLGGGGGVRYGMGVRLSRMTVGLDRES